MEKNFGFFHLLLDKIEKSFYREIEIVTKQYYHGR